MPSKNYFSKILKVFAFLSLLQACKFNVFIPNFDLSLTSLDPVKTGFRIEGSEMNESLGWSVSKAGDINGDGYADIIIGTPQKNIGKGAVYVIYGQPNFSSSYASLDLTTLDPATTGFIIRGNVAGDSLGFSVNYAGKVNDDAYDDIIIGAPTKNTNKGTVYVIYGGPSPQMDHIDLAAITLDPQTTGFTIAGDASYDYLGWPVSTAGDVDNDGYDDILIGAGLKEINRGTIYVIYGGPSSDMDDIDLATTTLDPATTGFKIRGNTAGDNFGMSLGSAGNVNKDDYDDIMIGAPSKNSNQGAVYVVYGRTRSLLSNIDLENIDLDPATTGFMVTKSSANDKLGQSVDTAGDINKDGFDDIVIGASEKSGGSGAVYVIYGRENSQMSDIDLSLTTLDPQTTGFIITDTDASNKGKLGYSVKAAGDVNGDGYPDIIAGAYKKSAYQGEAYVIYGGPTSSRSNIDLGVLDPTITGFMVSGNAAGDYFGFSVSGAGDMNQDGFDDIIIGAPSKNAGKGVTYIIHASCVTVDSNPCQERVFCESCDDEYNLSNSRCGGCPSNCQEYNGPAMCQTCNEGYFVSGAGCDNCPSNCERCEDSISCEICDNGYFLSENKCFLSCPGARFGDSNDGKCKDCPAYCTSCTSELLCETCEDGYFLSNSLCVKESSTIKTLSKTLQAMSDTTNVLGSILSVGSSLFPVTKLVSKIVQNTRYIGLIVTDELNQVYQEWNTELIEVDIPDAFSPLAQFKPLSYEFARYDLESAFLVNLWSDFVILGAALGIFILMRVLKKFLDQRETAHWLCLFVQRVIAGVLNFCLVQGYGCLDDVIFYFVLDLQTNPFNSVFSWMSFVTGLGIFGLGVGLILFNIVIVKRYQRAKRAKEVKNFIENNKRWELFYEDFSDVDSWSHSFLAILAVRNCLSSFIIATLYNFPGMQTSLLMVIDGAIIIFLLAKKPFLELRARWTQYFYETIALVVHISTFILGIQGDQVSVASIWKIVFCKAIIFLNYGLTIGGVGLMLLEIYKNMRPKIEAWRIKRKKTSQANQIALEEDSVNQSVLSTVKPIDLSTTVLRPQTEYNQRKQKLNIRRVRVQADSVLHFERPSALNNLN